MRSSAAQLAAEDSEALLVFSGGFTRAEAGARSEAGSYWAVADALGWFGSPAVAERAVVEDRARDSLENLLFSICRLREVSGGYPARVTVVSYDFKRARFLDIHARALGFPLDKVDFVGTPALDPQGAHKVRPWPLATCSHEKTGPPCIHSHLYPRPLQGEAATVKQFEADPYGCAGELAAKRRERDPFRLGTPTGDRCPALKPFLSGRCRSAPFRGPLPWQHSVRDSAPLFRRSAIGTQT